MPPKGLCTHLPFFEAAKAHKQILADILSVQSLKKPRTISELIHQTLTVRLRNSFGPIAMSFYFRYFVPHTGNPFVDEIVRVCSHSASRQRRMIPKLVEKYRGHVLRILHSAYWTCCLAEHYISLGFTLDLYTDHEFNESVMLLCLLGHLRTQYESGLSTSMHLPVVSHQAAIKPEFLKAIENSHRSTISRCQICTRMVIHPSTCPCQFIQGALSKIRPISMFRIILPI